jgi:hypothetical protein
MTRFRSLNPILLASASIIAWAFGSACATDRSNSGDGAVWFVHVTDPHIYRDTIENAGTVADPSKKEKLQKLDEEALTALFQQIPGLPQTYGSPAFLLITGDFGVDPCLIQKTKIKDEDRKKAYVCLNGFDPQKRTLQIDNLAGLLARSPVRDIYLIAGNNDLPLESATDDALAYFNHFFAEVQTKIAEKKSNVRLYNLTSCYAASDETASSCYKDVENTSYRVIGFPSQSFMNKEGDDQTNENSKNLEVKQFALFRSILDQAIHAERKILIVTHIPELDDPYLLGQTSYAKEDQGDAGSDKAKSSVSGWNVKDELLDGWKSAVASDSVVAVFAGHLHDAHKEIYRQPYSWSPQNDRHTALNKLFLAPPLSPQKQENSPIQARGFTTVTLFPHRTQTLFYWYDSSAKAFSPEHLPESARHHHPRWLARVHACFHWLWDLDHSDGPLERAAVLLIALLAAFLTVIAVWQIPPSDNPFAQKKPDDEKDLAKAAPEPSPFTTKLGKTVIAGLGGLLFTEIAKALCNQKLSDNAKCFYIVWFIVFFFLLLFLWSLVAGLAEAVRLRVAVINYPLARPPSPPHDGGDKKNNGAARWSRRFFDWLSYWFFLRPITWVFSLRVPALTFLDTFINLMQGKKQTGTRALSEVIIEQQKNIVRVADAIRKNLNDRIEFKIQHNSDSNTSTKSEEDREQPDTYQPHVRVNISVLSVDQSSVFYISRTPGSGVIPFTKRSVAWVSVFTGQIRWYNSTYYNDQGKEKKIILFDNSRGTIAGEEDRIMLSSHYQDRKDDYSAFVIFPVPWPQRAYGSKYVKGAIQISFREDPDFNKIWELDTVKPVDAGISGEKFNRYPDKVHLMLEDWCSDPGIRAALQNSITVLGELLYGFNEIIYKNYIEPDRTP